MHAVIYLRPPLLCICTFLTLVNPVTSNNSVRMLCFNFAAFILIESQLMYTLKLSCNIFQIQKLFKIYFYKKKTMNQPTNQ